MKIEKNGKGVKTELWWSLYG